MMAENLNENLEQNIHTGRKSAEALPNMEKVSEVKEIVGESASENPSDSVKKKKKDDKTKPAKVKKQKTATVKTTQPLPSVAEQQKQVKRAVARQIRSLQWEAFKEKVTPGFDASRFEELVMKIRSLKMILAKIKSATAELLADWYQKFVNTRL